MSQTHSNQNRWSWGGLIRGLLELLMILAVLGLAGFIAYGTYLRIDHLEKNNNTDVTDVDEALESLERTRDDFDQLLSLLEGAGVLATVAVGAAAFYGMRNARETREELRKEMERIETLREKLEEDYDTYEELFSQYGTALTNLPKNIARLETAGNEVNELIQDIQPVFNGLLQAYQELRLKNYREAYTAVERVLEQDPDNSQALYMAGWLEFQYIDGRLDDGIWHLEQALQLVPEWPSAKAAYGVLLRRKGLRSDDSETREKYLAEAEGHLRGALIDNPNLIDLNMESFWGPLGGTLRDRKLFDQAIDAYEMACRVTPGSSYPRGNLAALYLKKTQDDPGMAAQTLKTFQETSRLAHVELSQSPNDYYLIMDIAMASAVLGRQDEAEFGTAEEWLTDALASPSLTPEMLNVSLRGWGYLREYCPGGWTNVRAFINRAIERLEAVRRQIEAAEKTDGETNSNSPDRA